MLFRHYVQLTFINHYPYENDNHMHHVTVTIRTMTYVNCHDDTMINVKPNTLMEYAMTWMSFLKIIQRNFQTFAFLFVRPTNLLENLLHPGLISIIVQWMMLNDRCYKTFQITNAKSFQHQLKSRKIAVQIKFKLVVKMNSVVRFMKIFFRLMNAIVSENFFISAQRLIFLSLLSISFLIFFSLNFINFGCGCCCRHHQHDTSQFIIFFRDSSTNTFSICVEISGRNLCMNI